MGSLLGAEPSRPFLTTTPALPYPALLTPLFSFRMKKAGIDLPMRQFQGTLDPYKCLRPFLVAPPGSCFPSLFLTKPPNPVSTQSALLWASDGLFFSVGL